MKYKKGDKVVMKPDVMIAEAHSPYNGHSVFERRHLSAPLKGTDRVVEIIDDCDSDDDVYWSKLPDSATVNIAGCDILGPAFEYGEEIEVRDGDNQDWVRERFCAYLPGRKLPIVCLRDDSNHARYWFVRPIQPDTDENSHKALLDTLCNVNRIFGMIGDSIFVHKSGAAKVRRLEAAVKAAIAAAEEK